jgi:hypothetical protein
MNFAKAQRVVEKAGKDARRDGVERVKTLRAIKD